MTEVKSLPIDQIKPQKVERPLDQKFIYELSESIKRVGILEPLTVAKANGDFVLVFGRHRLEAARAAGLTHVPCLEIEPDAHKTIAATLHENLFRRELNAYDEAQLYAHLSAEMKLSNRDIAKMAAKSEAYISQRLSMFRWLPELVSAVRKNEISFSVARELSSYHDSKRMKFLLGIAIQQGSNYRTVRSWRQRDEAEIGAPTSDEPADETTPASPKVFRPYGRCFWCEDDVDLDKLVDVHLCMDDYKQLMEAKEKSRQGPT
jgi:ParB family chromosome partitioning protein